MKKLFLILALLCWAIPSFAVSPATCYAVANGNWNNASIWSSTAGGAGGTCAASGGAGLTIEGQTATLAAGVPGAAGLLDHAVANTGITVHVTAGVGVDLGNKTYSSGGDGLVVNATNATTYGSVIVDDGGLVKLHGSSSSANNAYATIAQYAVFQVMPGGYLWIGDASNGPLLNVNGRFYVGCGDQTKYPSPACSGNAGAWVTVSVAGTLNITAVSSLPTLSAGDLVELDPIPQRPSDLYPYNIDGKTPPPAPPVMPITNDTGTSPMRACGSASDCAVPEGTPLCVVAVSGQSVSLGWPQGGTTAQPYCTGTETAINITDAGSGKLWLKKPAFLWGDPATVTWNTSRSMTPSSVFGAFDSTRSALALNNAPISNAAGDGPGRKGDNSLTINSNNWNAPCTFNSIAAVTSNGCYINYDKGVIFSYGYNQGYTGSLSYKTISTVAVGTKGSIQIPSGTRTYNELVIENADVRYLYGNYAGAFIRFGNLDNSANRHIAYRFNTVRYSESALGFYSLNGSASAPIEVTENAVYESNWTSDSFTGFANSYTDSSYVDISHNYINRWHTPIICMGANPTFVTSTNFTITNNVAYNDAFIVDRTQACKWPGLKVQDNRITGIGKTAGSGWPYQMTFGLVHNNGSGISPAVFSYNYQYGGFRFAEFHGNSEWHHNYVAHNWHHMAIGGEVLQSGGGYIPNVKVHHNILAHYDLNQQAVACWEIGYNKYSWFDGFQFYNNTCLGMSWAGLGLSDLGDNNAASLVTGLIAKDNIFATLGSTNGTGPGFSKGQNSYPSMAQAQLSFMGYNSTQGTVPMYKGAKAGNPESYPNPEYNRNVMVTYDGGNYNLDANKNVKGIAIQNPSYTTGKTGAAVRYTYTSASDRTLAWALDGSTYGAETQLNWAGAGTTYTVASITDPGVTYNYETVTVTTTPFAAIPSQGTPMPTNCPVTRWAVFLTGAAAGQTFAITNCTSTSAIEVSPRPTVTIAANDTFAILKSEARLTDAGGTDYVDAGIDPRSLPATSQTDTGINLALTDYCASGCGAASVVTGLPTSYTQGTSNSPLIAIDPPWAGGSAEAAFTEASYRPSGTSWTTSSSTGSYLGAIPPLEAPSGTRKRVITVQ